MGLFLRRRTGHFIHNLRESDGWPELLFVSGTATAFTFFLVKVAYALAAEQYIPFKTEQLKFAFSFPIHYWFVIVSLATGMVILETKQWIAISAFGFFCYCAAIPVYASSGPVGRVFPLLELRVNLVLAAFPINVALLVLWNAAAKRSAPSVSCNLQEGKLTPSGPT